jgi:hypothetical protein
MTKAEWISVIKNTLMKVDEQSRYREPLLERHIQSVYEQMFNELYISNKGEMDKYVRTYGEGAVGSGLVTGHKLTNTPISLPRVGGGVFKVFTSGSLSIDFMVTSYRGYWNYKNTKFDTADVVGRRMCYLSGDELWSDVNIGSDSLIVLIIPKFTTLSSEDEVLIPGGQEDHFIDRVIDTIQHLPPTDLINDNTIQ